LTQMTELEKPHKTPSRVLLEVAVSALVLLSLLDTSGAILHLKEPVFATIFLIWIYRQMIPSSRIDRERRQKLPRYIWIVALGVAVVVPFISTMIGLLTSDLHSGEAPLGVMKSFLFFSIVLVLISEEIDLISYIVKLSPALAMATIGLVVLSLFSPELFLGVSFFIEDKKNGIFWPGRNLLGLGIGEFVYGACPIMIFAFSYYFDRATQYGVRKLSSVLMCSLFSVALILSGARADILAALSIALILTIRKVRRASGWVPALTLGAIVAVLAAVTVIPNFTDMEEGSNAIKLKHIHSYNKEFSSRPAVLLFGEGANSAFYTEGFESWTILTEVTYLELVRVYGLPMVILFAAGLLWIGYRLFANGLFTMGLAFFAFLGIAGTNPLIVSSTGFLAIAAMYEQAVRQVDRPLPRRNHFRLRGSALP
jgi:MFS family permease